MYYRHLGWASMSTDFSKLAWMVSVHFFSFSEHGGHASLCFLCVHSEILLLGTVKQTQTSQGVGVHQNKVEWVDGNLYVRMYALTERVRLSRKREQTLSTPSPNFYRILFLSSQWKSGQRSLDGYYLQSGDWSLNASYEVACSTNSGEWQANEWKRQKIGTTDKKGTHLQPDPTVRMVGLAIALLVHEYLFVRR